MPFLPVSAKSDSPKLNMFASRGEDLLNAVMMEIQIQLGRMTKYDKLARLGAASFSSGVDFMTQFLRNMSPSGLIKEVMDFDSAHMQSAHTTVSAMAGVATWQITQAPPPGGFRIGWLYLPQDAFTNITEYGPSSGYGVVHANIGYMMFRSMMTVSVL